MIISELFYSIQGEGKRAGFPSFFIRTNYCNLRCKFKSGNLCDSSYSSWYPDDNNLGNMEISEIIDEYKKYKTNEVVITGGEPAIQPRELNLLCLELKKLHPDVFITLETNGTYIGEFIKYIDLASVSPKLKSSVPYSSEYEKFHEKNRIQIDVLKEYNNFKNDGSIDIQWKFVICDSDDMEEILYLRDKTGISNRDIYLMPEGIKKTDLDKKRKIVFELCKKYSMNFTDRYQIIIWGNKRGV